MSVSKHWIMQKALKLMSDPRNTTEYDMILGLKTAQHQLYLCGKKILPIEKVVEDGLKKIKERLKERL